MNVDVQMNEAETTVEAAERAAALRRWRSRGVEVLPGETAEETVRRHWPNARVENGRMRVDSADEVGIVEHEVDAKPDDSLEPDPFWEKMGERGEGALRLFEAGLKKKAYRYADCMTRAEKAPCSSFPKQHKFYKSYHCMNRFCKYDGPLHKARLRAAYQPGLVKFLRDSPVPSGYLLSRMNYSKRCHGELPLADEIQAFNEAVGRALGKAVRSDLLRWSSRDATRKVLVWENARNRRGKNGSPKDSLPVQIEVGEALKRRKVTFA